MKQVKFRLLILIILLNVFFINAKDKSIKVTLDYYFNNERRINEEGKLERFHYVWEEKDNQGFSIFGKIFTDFGAELSMLNVAPTKNNLKGTSIYIIVDPDGLKDNPKPNFIKTLDIRTITHWVKQGGVLVLLANDSANCDLFHLNNLAKNFGIKFTNRSRNMVKGNDFAVGSVLFSENDVFKNIKKVYLKEISILEVKPPAIAITKMDNDVIMAVSKFGKGTVFAVGDPWFYNEYINGQNIPVEFENFEAGKELVKWLLSITK